MTENPKNESMSWLWFVAIVALAVIFLLSVGIRGEEAQRSCMDSVVTPDPQAIDYDNQSLEFSSEIRKCLRG